MKKLAVLFVLIWTYAVYGQESGTTSVSVPSSLPKFQFGIKVSGTNTNVSIDLNNLNEYPKEGWGYEAGLMTRHNFLEWMRFYGSLDYARKNFTIPDRLPSVNDIKERVEVLAQMFKFNLDVEFLPIKGLGLHVGPYLSYWQAGEAVITRSGDNIPTEVENFEIQAASAEIDVNNLPDNVLLVNPWDFGITGGLSYDLGKIFVEAKYEIGLSDLNNMAQSARDSGLFKFNDNNSGNADLPPIKFRTLTIGITYWFN